MFGILTRRAVIPNFWEWIYTYVIVSAHYLMFSALVESITSSPSTDDKTPSKDGSRCRYD